MVIKSSSACAKFNGSKSRMHLLLPNTTYNLTVTTDHNGTSNKITLSDASDGKSYATLDLYVSSHRIDNLKTNGSAKVVSCNDKSYDKCFSFTPISDENIAVRFASTYRLNLHSNSIMACNQDPINSNERDSIGLCEKLGDPISRIHTVTDSTSNPISGLSAGVTVLPNSDGKIFYAYYSGGADPHYMYYIIGTPNKNGDGYSWSHAYPNNLALPYNKKYLYITYGSPTNMVLRCELKNNQLTLFDCVSISENALSDNNGSLKLKFNPKYNFAYVSSRCASGEYV